MLISSYFFQKGSFRDGADIYRIDPIGPVNSNLEEAILVSKANIEELGFDGVDAITENIGGM